MSERKVLNKYYPPDYDPSKIPKLHLKKNRQFSIRVMVPFNCRCNNCGEYIYKGKKFNSRSEMVINENYLGLRIYRFYIRCPCCVSEIAFKTDPEKADYELEAGATRNFEPLRTAEQLAIKEMKEKEEEEKNNPMKVLENRTKASRQEMDLIENLAELKEMNARHGTVDHEYMLKLHEAYDEQLKKLIEEEDEKFVRSVFGASEEGAAIRRLKDDDEEDDSEQQSSSDAVKAASKRLAKTTDELVAESEGPSKKRAKPEPALKKATIASMIKRKTPAAASAFTSAANDSGASSAGGSEPASTVAASINAQSDSTGAPLPDQQEHTTQSSSNGACAAVNRPGSTSSNAAPAKPGLSLVSGYSSSSDDGD